MNILIYRTPTCNLSNISRAISALGHNFHVSNEIKNSIDYDALIVPGVGNYGYVMSELEGTNFKDLVFDFIERNKKILGICLGFQLLFDGSEEAPGVSGLGVFSGQFHGLPEGYLNVPPKIGFSGTTISESNGRVLFNQDFYYLHKFALPLSAKSSFDVVGTSKFYDHEYISFVKKGQIFGCQFHPELSGQLGLQFLSDILIKPNDFWK